MNNGSITYRFTVAKKGENTRTVSDRTYATEIFTFSAEAVRDENMFRLSGEAETIKESYVVHRVSATATTSSGKTIILTLTLSESNVDLTIFRDTPSSQATINQLSTLYLLGGDNPMQYLSVLTNQETSDGGGAVEKYTYRPADDRSSSVAVFGGLAAAAIFSAGLLTLRRNGAKAVSKEIGRKPHYV
jgi:hypothetical protein